MAVKFRAGQQLVSAVDSTAVIVIRAPAGECTLTCGGVAMAAPGEVAAAAGPDPSLMGGSQIGKRYVDEADTIQVLCTKAGSGTLAEVGIGQGRGLNVNIPLPAGSGDRGYALAFEKIVEPITKQFSPDLILVSAGQDASAADPLGRMSLTTEGFRDMASRITALAQDICSGRLVALQEGGYSLDHLPFCTLAIVEAMAGLQPTIKGDLIFGRTNDVNCDDNGNRIDNGWYQVGRGRDNNSIYERRTRDRNGNLVIQRARRNSNGTMTIIRRLLLRPIPTILPGTTTSSSQVYKTSARV